MSELKFDKPFTGGTANTRFKKDRKVKTIKFDQIVANGDTVIIDNASMPKGTFIVKVTGNSNLEFQGSAVGGTDDTDWINMDEGGEVHTHNDKTDGYSFENYVNFIRVRVGGVTGTVDITLILGE